MPSTNKYLIYLASKEGFFVRKDLRESQRDNFESNEIVITSELEKAKWYESYSGAMSGCYSLLEESPQIMTLEVTVEPTALSEIITKSKWESSKKEKDEKQHKKLISTLDKQREELIANWNKEQGIQ